MDTFNIREKTEELEKKILSPYAAFSCDAARENAIEECNIRTAFQRDRDRILHSKSFRRLKHKTQVFLSPEGDHYRTRLTHTLEVSQIARTISRALGLNEDLTEAISLGHDLGHTPFGHAGERALKQVDSEFEHNKQSLRVVKYLENSVGLNLTKQVNDGILNHKKRLKPMTLEGMIVNFADRFAYINHDIDDAIRAGILRNDEIPKEAREFFGETHSKRIGSMIFDIVDNSYDNIIVQSKEASRISNELREFMFKSVYLNPKAKSEEGKAEGMILSLYDAFYKDPSVIPDDRTGSIEEYGKKQAIIDYIASMTDRYVIKVYSDMFIPVGWKVY
jgi:dGTPase